MNSASLTGRSTRDPEMRYTANTQVANARFVVAVDRKLGKEKRQGAENDRYPTADFISCVTWGKTAGNIGNYLHKGNRTATTGRIQTGSYESQQGQRIHVTDVIVDSPNLVESNSSSSIASQGYSNPVDLGMNGQESFDSKLPFLVM